MENYRIHEEIFYDFNNGKKYKTAYQYDKNGFLEKTIQIRDEKIYETKYIYGNEGLLLSTEEYTNERKISRLEYIYGKGIILKSTTIEKQVLRKGVTYFPAGIFRYYYVYIFSDNTMIKALRYSPENMLEYEFIIQYDGNKRIRTLKPNLEILSTREYDENGLLKEINLSFGGKSTFIWEEGITNYDFDMYSVC